MTELERSYAWCESVARKRAKNFYYSFVLLSREQKNAMCAVYAFMRYCDDLSDEAGANRIAIEQWRAELTHALEGSAGTLENPPLESPKYAEQGRAASLAGGLSTSMSRLRRLRKFSFASPRTKALIKDNLAAGLLWPAFRDSVDRFRIPHEYFHQMIDGVLSDLDPKPVTNFDNLYRYCYQVASVVGLTIVHIFGFDDPKALKLAEKCGIAFQLTNILRDVREDAAMGRQYLPSEDLTRFQVSTSDLARGNRSDRFIRLMEFESQRARAYYDESWPLVRMVHPRSRASLWALITIYSRLLDRIRKSNYDVLSQRVSLPGREKAWIVVRAGVRSLLS